MTTAQGLSQDESYVALIEGLVAHFTKSDLQPEIKGDNDYVEFVFANLRFLIQPSKTDEGYFRLLLPSFWIHKAEISDKHFLDVLNETNISIKVVKTIIVGKEVWAVAEFYLADFSLFPTYVQRLLNYLLAARTFFTEKIETPKKLLSSQSDQVR